MDQPYVMAYYIPLFIFGLISLALNDKDFIRITFISTLAFGATRVIALVPESNRYMFEFSNDVAVCIALLVLVKNNKFVPWLIATYTLMWIGAYIPFALKWVTHTQHQYILEAISALQLFLIFGGIINGTGPRRLFKYCTDIGYSFFVLVRSEYIQKTQKGVERTGNDFGNMGGVSVPVQENSKQVTHTPTYGNRATTFWKPL